MIGEFNFAAVSKAAFTLLEPITFTAGSANLFSFAYWKMSVTICPVATPAGNFLLITDIFIDLLFAVLGTVKLRILSEIFNFFYHYPKAVSGGLFHRNSG